MGHKTWKTYPRWVGGIGVLVVALAAATLALTGQLNRYFYRPVDVDDNYWVDISAGEFLMGSGSSSHTVFLDTFWISQTEVTNTLYKQCVDAGVCDPPGCGYYGDDVYNDHPVVCVDWRQSQTYCEWVGGSLPTEAQWEKAARGTDGRTYPWGEVINANLANYELHVGETTAVGSYPEGASPYGVLDIAGNVWEWSRSCYQDYPYNAGDGREDLTANCKRVLRGGGWNGSVFYLQSAFRLNFFPKDSSHNFGFRCARSLP